MRLPLTASCPTLCARIDDCREPGKRKEKAKSSTVFLAFANDAYISNPDCTRDLLHAVESARPVIVLYETAFSRGRERKDAGIVHATLQGKQLEAASPSASLAEYGTDRSDSVAQRHSVARISVIVRDSMASTQQPSGLLRSANVWTKSLKDIGSRYGALRFDQSQDTSKGVLKEHLKYVQRVQEQIEEMLDLSKAKDDVTGILATLRKAFEALEETKFSDVSRKREVKLKVTLDRAEESIAGQSNHAIHHLKAAAELILAEIEGQKQRAAVHKLRQKVRRAWQPERDRPDIVSSSDAPDESNWLQKWDRSVDFGTVDVMPWYREAHLQRAVLAQIMRRIKAETLLEMEVGQLADSLRDEERYEESCKQWSLESGSSAWLRCIRAPFSRQEARKLPWSEDTIFVSGCYDDKTLKQLRSAFEVKRDTVFDGHTFAKDIKVEILNFTKTDHLVDSRAALLHEPTLSLRDDDMRAAEGQLETKLKLPIILMLPADFLLSNADDKHRAHTELRKHLHELVSHVAWLLDPDTEWDRQPLSAILAKDSMRGLVIPMYSVQGGHTVSDYYREIEYKMNDWKQLGVTYCTFAKWVEEPWLQETAARGALHRAMLARRRIDPELREKISAKMRKIKEQSLRLISTNRL